jgi:hypothetical protein
MYFTIILELSFLGNLRQNRVLKENYVDYRASRLELETLN